MRFFEPLQSVNSMDKRAPPLIYFFFLNKERNLTTKGSYGTQNF